MKGIKRLAALALAAVMAVAMVVPAWAAADDTQPEPEFTGTITVSNPQQGATYHAYKLLDLYAPEGTASAQVYGFKDDSAWAKFFLDEVEGVNTAPVAEYFDVVEVTDEKGYQVAANEYWNIDYVVTLKATVKDQDAAGAAIAKLALEWVSTYDVPVAGTLENAGYSRDSAITVHEPGYYLVDTNTGSLGSLGTMGGTDADGNATDTLEVDEKNELPTLIKQVWDRDTAPTGEDELFAGMETLVNMQRMVSRPIAGEQGSWFDQTSASFNDTVHYRLYVNASKGAERYWIFDRLDPSLDLVENSFEVYKYDGTNKTSLTQGTDWTLETNLYYVEQKDEKTFSHTCSFIVKFNDDVVSALKEGEFLVVFYNAILNETAVAEANANIAVLGTGKGDLQYTEISEFTANETEIAKYVGNEVPSVQGSKPTGEGVALFCEDIVSAKFSTALVYSYYFDLVKTDKDDNVLSGAKFQLLDENKNPISLVRYEDPFAGAPDGVNRALFDYLGTGMSANMRIISVNDSMLDDLINMGRMSNGMYAAMAGLQSHRRQQGWKYYARTEYSTTPWTEKPEDGTTIEHPAETFTYVDRDAHYRLAKPGETGITEFEAGHIRFVGLDAGTYYLHEVKAPEGYNTLAVDQKIVLSNPVYNVSAGGSNGTAAGGVSAAALKRYVVLYINDSENSVPVRGDVTLVGETEKTRFYPEMTKYLVFRESMYQTTTGTGTDAGGKNPPQIDYGTIVGGLDDGANGGVQIINLTGAELPHTGGMGTTLFYAVGGLLVVGAGILLVVKKRMKSEE